MPLTKKQMKELTTTYVDSPLEQIQKNQIKMCTELKEIKNKQEKISKWKHKHEDDIHNIAGFLKNTFEAIKELKLIIGNRVWKKRK